MDRPVDLSRLTLARSQHLEIIRLKARLVALIDAQRPKQTALRSSALQSHQPTDPQGQAQSQTQTQGQTQAKKQKKLLGTEVVTAPAPGTATERATESGAGTGTGTGTGLAWI